MVSNLHAEFKDPKLNFSEIFAKNSLFDDVDYSWRYWLREKPLNQKTHRREQLSKVIYGNKTHEQKQLTQQKHLSDHSRFMIKLLAPWTLKPKIQIQIPEKLF